MWPLANNRQYTQKTAFIVGSALESLQLKISISMILSHQKSNPGPGMVQYGQRIHSQPLPLSRNVWSSLITATQVHPANLMNETFSKDSQSQLVLST